MKVLRWLLLLLVVLVVVLAIAIAMFPARVAVAWFAPRGALQLDDVTGTVWHGQARQVRLHGQPLGALGWKIAPGSLLGRRIDADLTIDGSEFQGGGWISADRERILLRDAKLAFGAARLQPALDIPALNLHGTIEVELRQAELVDSFPRRLDGRATWRGAAVDGAAAAQLGDLIAEFQTAADGSLVGTVFDNGGPLALDGQFKLGFAGYEAEAVLAARDGNPQVREALRHVGQIQPDGSAILEIRGRMLPLQ